MPVSETGPYLIMAALCERAIREVDNVVSVIRVADKVTGRIVGPVIPDVLPPVPVSLTLVIMLRAGQARGSYTLRIRPEPPSGPPLAETEVPVSFTGTPEMGANLIVNLTMAVDQEGAYWITVLLNDDLLTRIPLLVEYSFQQTEAQPDSPESPESRET
jgi:hypothetical protein